MNGTWYEGYWAAVRQSKSLNTKRIEQLLRFEDAVVRRILRTLSWHEGRRDGFKTELRYRSYPTPWASMEVPAERNNGRHSLRGAS